jgi:hypothetical protein
MSEPRFTMAEDGKKDDLISRQAVVDLLMKYIPDTQEPQSGIVINDDWNSAIRKAIILINQLPRGGR